MYMFENGISVDIRFVDCRNRNDLRLPWIGGAYSSIIAWMKPS